MNRSLTSLPEEKKPSVQKMSPSLGFLGVGWIGKSRMESLVSGGLADPIAVCDTYEKQVSEALKVAPAAHVCPDLCELLEQEVEGVVIATPSALHAQHSISCLRAGKAVFCQKPLGRHLAETHKIVEEARKADRLLAVDYSYRYTHGMQEIRRLVNEGAFGKIYAIETVFHNAYGPDKSWFYDPQLSGGGCLMDLGSHLVDLSLWILDFPQLEVLSANILADGQPVMNHWEKVEDYVSADMRTPGGVSVRLTCSWNLPIGRDAEISFRLYGTEGGAAFYNVNGSFYDFQSEWYRGTSRELLTSPPEDWGGAAISRWAAQLAADPSYSDEAEELIESAAVLEAIYHHVRK